MENEKPDIEKRTVTEEDLEKGKKKGSIFGDPVVSFE